MLRFGLRALLLCFVASPTFGATWEIERRDRRPIRPVALEVKMSGPIERGDAARLAILLVQESGPEVRDILFMMHSPGGNLAEGIAIGRVIASRSEIRSAEVGSKDRPDAFCASACVLAYLGADYRYLSRDGRIGVHRFSAPDTRMDGAEGMATAQEISATITEYIRAQRASPALYERMSRTGASDIDWVERSTLEDWRVVIGPVYDEIVEVRNVNGSVALHLVQIALYGDNHLTLLCGDAGLVGVAALNKPEVYAYGRMELAIDGEAIRIDHYGILEQNERIARLAFAIPQAQEGRIAMERRFGARVVLPSEVGFFGFEMSIRNDLLREMVAGCRSRPADSARQRGMRVAQGVDYPGGDMTQSGLRGIEFGACKAACQGDPSCLAVCYVIEKKWCWPKASVGRSVPASGSVSAVK